MNSTAISTARTAPARSLTAIAARLLAALLLTLLTLAAAPAHAQEADPKVDTTLTEAEIHNATVQPGLVRITTTWKAWVKDQYGWLNNGRPFTWTTSCSGFFANPDGYIVTAGHCVDPSREAAGFQAVKQGTQWLIDEGYYKAKYFDLLVSDGLTNWNVVGATKGSPIARDVRVSYGQPSERLRDGTSAPARVIEVRRASQGDVALLKIQASDMPVLPIATEQPTVGTTVASVGFGQATDAGSDATFQPAFKDGEISKIGTRDGGLLPVFEVSSPLSPGMSGGPSIDAEGNVIGVNSYTIRGEDSSFAFLSPAELVHEMLARSGVDNELGDTDEHVRDTITAMEDGQFGDALTAVGLVLDARPDSEAAKALKAKATTGAEIEAAELAAEEAARQKALAAAEAQAALEAQQARQRTMLIAGAVLALIAASAAAVLVLRRRSADSPAADPSDEEPTIQHDPVAVAAPVGFTPASPVSGVATGSVDAVNGNGSGPVTVLERTVRFCQACGTDTTIGAKFCAGCGTPVA